MKRINLFSAILLLVAMCFVACSEKIVEKPVEDPRLERYWGYFDGTFDGTRSEDDMTVVFENDKDNNSYRMWTLYSNHTELASIVGCEDFRMHVDVKDMRIKYIDGATEDESSFIDMSIAGLSPTRLILISQPIRESEQEDYISLFSYSTIRLVRNYPGNPEPVCYVPKRENPFEVTLQHVLWGPVNWPVLDMTLNGTLYREDAPERDSITISANCGVGWLF